MNHLTSCDRHANRQLASAKLPEWIDSDSKSKTRFGSLLVIIDELEARRKQGGEPLKEDVHGPDLQATRHAWGVE